MKLSSLKGLPNNPRIIKDAQFMRLVDKVLSLPDGLKANRIAYVTDGCEVEGVWHKGKYILSGNQRHKALQHIVKMTDDDILENCKRLGCEQLAEFWYGFKERGELPSDWVQDVTHLDASDRRHLILAMNVSDGQWDNDILANEWDAGELSWAGIDRWEAEDVESEQDCSDKNREIDIDDLDGTMVIKLQYTEAEYHIVKGALQKIAALPEQAVWKLLNLDNNEL